MSTASKAFSIEDLRTAARRRLPQAIFDFFDGGAEDELTLDDNQAAFRRIRLLPKVLTDVSHTQTGVQLMGKTVAHYGCRFPGK
jgi:(S)-mandelate dehydrogenase